MQFGPLEVKLHNQAVQEWLERTRFIAEEYLDECYQMAMDNHATRSPLIPRELYEQWSILRQRGAGKLSEKREKTCRYWCSEGGWIIVDADGVPVPSDFRRPEYTYAKPCPDHRPKGVRISGENPMVSGLPRPKHVDTTFVSSRKEREGSSEGFQQMAKVAEQILAQQPEPIADDLGF